MASFPVAPESHFLHPYSVFPRVHVTAIVRSVKKSRRFSLRALQSFRLGAPPSAPTTSHPSWFEAAVSIGVRWSPVVCVPRFRSLKLCVSWQRYLKRQWGSKFGRSIWVPRLRFGLLCVGSSSTHFRRLSSQLYACSRISSGKSWAESGVTMTNVPCPCFRESVSW